MPLLIYCCTKAPRSWPFLVLFTSMLENHHKLFVFIIFFYINYRVIAHIQTKINDLYSQNHIFHPIFRPKLSTNLSPHPKLCYSLVKKISIFYNKISKLVAEQLDTERLQHQIMLLVQLRITNVPQFVTFKTPDGSVSGTSLLGDHTIVPIATFLNHTSKYRLLELPGLKTPVQSFHHLKLWSLHFQCLLSHHKS